MTLNDLKSVLQDINFSLLHAGANHYVIVNNLKEELPFVIWKNDLTVNPNNEHRYTVHFSLRNMGVSILSKNSISIGTENHFINLYKVDK